MSDDLLTNQAEAPEVTHEESPEEVSYDFEHGEEGEPESEVEATEEDELEEVEYEGKKHKLPKELKDALLRQADYTRKTQEVAEQRRAIEAQAQALQEQAKAQQANLHDYARLAATDEQINQYSAINWNAWTQQDPIEAQKAFVAFQQLKDTRQNLANQISQREQQAAAESQAARAKAIQEGNAVLSREIKGWNGEVAAKLRDFAVKDLGFTEQDVAQVYDPRVVKLLHRAWLGSQLEERTRKTTSPPPDVVPAPTIKGKSSPKGAPKDINAWMEYRNSQVRKGK